MTTASAFDGLSTDIIQNALSYIPANDRTTWVNMAMAVKSELGTSGFDVWDQWSQTAGAGYNKRSAQEVWKSVKPGGAVTIASLIHEAKLRGFTMTSEAAKPDPAVIAERKAKKDADRKAYEAEQAEKQQKAADRSKRIWDTCTKDGVSAHPYVLRKGITVAGQAKIGTFPIWDKASRKELLIENSLIIPIRDAAKNLVSLQAIFPDVVEAIGRDRTYIPNGKKSGGYTNIGIPAGDNPVILICEGYATGETLHAATGHCVFVAFDAPNLPAVAGIARKRLTDARILMCADNDQWGISGNDGIKFASQAAAAVGGTICCPEFFEEETKPTDFNDLHELEGLDVVACQIESVLNPPVEPVEVANDNAPEKPERIVNYMSLNTYFTILGYDRETIFVFQHEARQMLTLSRADLSTNALISLAPLPVWQFHYPAKSKPFEKDNAVDWLIREARRLPVFNPARVRGRGAWYDNSRSVFHFGDHLSVDGEHNGIGQLATKFIYQAEIPLDIEADAPALTDDEGKMLIDIAKRFRWVRPASAPMLAGWAALAPFCGALAWRPHIWVTGGAGCGKTTIVNRYVNLLTSRCNIFAQGNSTEAGIRQTLRSDALPVIFDESEQNDERESMRVQNILSLIRQASSESGAKTLKGTTGGHSMAFQVRSMFCLSSIQVGMKQKADYDRLTILGLQNKAEKGSKDEKESAANWDFIKETLHLMERDKTLPDRLFKRMLNMLPVIQSAVEVFLVAGGRHFGNQRDGDQFGTLMAGAWCLMNSRVPTEDEAAVMLASYDWAEYTQSSAVDDAEKAMSALMEARIKSAMGGDYSVYELVDKIAHIDNIARSVEEPPTCGISKPDCQATLSRAGMRVKDGMLLISNTSDGFTKLLSGTQYQADARRLLCRVTGVVKDGGQHWINGGNTRCIAVPLDLFI